MRILHVTKSKKNRVMSPVATRVVESTDEPARIQTQRKTDVMDQMVASLHLHFQLTAFAIC